MDEYFYKVSHNSEIVDFVWSKKESYDWHTSIGNNQFQVRGFPQSLILKDKFLSFINKNIKGKLKLFKLPPNCVYRWHKDSNNLYNFNLVFEEQDAFVLFRSSNIIPENWHIAITSVTRLNYIPKCWYLFNADIEHSVFNLSDNWRYLLTYNVPRTTDISYGQARLYCMKFMVPPQGIDPI